MENAQKILKKSKSLEKKIEEYEMVKNKFEDILVLLRRSFPNKYIIWKI